MATFRSLYSGRLSLVLAGLAGVTACISDPGEPAPETAQVSAYFRDDCGEFACGQNGARMGGVPFYGLWLNGDENEQHVRYLHYAQSLPALKLGLYQTLDVDGGHLRVWSGGTWASGPAALEGGILQLAIGRKGFYVKIAEVRSGTVTGEDIGEAFWSRVGSPDAETYQLQWAPVDGPVDANGNPRFEDVCPHDTLAGYWGNQIDAVIFEGGKYNLQT